MTEYKELDGPTRGRINERLCRSVLWLAWEDAKDEDWKDWGDCKDEMPEFPRPKMVRYSGGNPRPEVGFYRRLLYEMVNDVPFWIKELQ